MSVSMAWRRRMTALAVDMTAKVPRTAGRYSPSRWVSLIRTVKARTTEWAVLRTERPRSWSAVVTARLGGGSSADHNKNKKFTK